MIRPTTASDQWLALAHHDADNSSELVEAHHVVVSWGAITIVCSLNGADFWSPHPVRLVSAVGPSTPGVPGKYTSFYDTLFDVLVHKGGPQPILTRLIVVINTSILFRMSGPGTSACAIGPHFPVIVSEEERCSSFPFGDLKKKKKSRRVPKTSTVDEPLLSSTKPSKSRSRRSPSSSPERDPSAQETPALPAAKVRSKSPTSSPKLANKKSLDKASSKAKSSPPESGHKKKSDKASHSPATAQRAQIVIRERLIPPTIVITPPDDEEVYQSAQAKAERLIATIALSSPPSPGMLAPPRVHSRSKARTPAMRAARLGRPSAGGNAYMQSGNQKQISLFSILRHGSTGGGCGHMALTSIDRRMQKLV